MSSRSLGIAILLHALVIGVALRQDNPNKPVQPQAVMSVVADVEPPSSLPQPQSSPALTRAWPVPELALPGAVPAPDRELIPEPEPDPVFEPDPEFNELEPLSPRQPAIKANWKRREKPPEAPADKVEAPAANPQSKETTTTRETGVEPAPGKIEGFAAPDTPPRIIAPSWPRSVRRNFDGTVEIKVVVGTNGRALRVEIQEGTGNLTWDDDLREAFKDADYTPGMHNGMVLITSHIFRVHFRRTR